MQHCTIDNDAVKMPADEVVYHVNAHINYRPLPSLYEQCICVCVGIERIKIKELSDSKQQEKAFNNTDHPLLFIQTFYTNPNDFIYQRDAFYSLSDSSAVVRFNMLLLPSMVRRWFC